MPTINGQRVLANSPQAIASQNARGGIDKVSNRERMGEVAGGTTGTTAAPELRSERLTSMGISPTLAAPKLNVDIPNVIPSTALSGGQTLEDLYTQRDNLQASADVQKGINEQITGLQGRIGAKASPIYANTDEMINRLLLNRVPTSTEQARNTLASTASQNRRDYTTEFSTAREQLGQAYNLPTLQENLGKTREQYAAREVKMNEDLKRVEENALYRGVDRAFAEAEKNKIKSQALEDLANLATIEKAQSGNVAEAKDDINTIIDDKKEAFKLENDAIQADIDYLNTLVGEDNQRQAQQLLFALNERKAAQEKILADEKEIKGYMADAAANGADQGTIQAIMNATSPEEALRFASPFIGKYDRLQAQASLANTYNQIASRELNDKLARLEAGDTSVAAELNITLPDGTQPNSDLIAYAQQYAATGKIPSGMPKDISFGAVAEYAKDLPKPTGTLVNANTGVTDTSLGQAEKDDMVRLYNITEMVGKLKALDEARMSGVIPGVLGKVSGSEAQAAYLAQRKAIVDELARMQTGAALSDYEQAFYNDYLPGRFSEAFFLGKDSGAQIDNFASVMNEKLQNALKNNQLSIYGYSTVNLDGQDYKVGEIITNEYGQQGLVQPDGSITLVNQ